MQQLPTSGKCTRLLSYVDTAESQQTYVVTTMALMFSPTSLVFKK